MRRTSSGGSLRLRLARVHRLVSLQNQASPNFVFAVSTLCGFRFHGKTRPARLRRVLMFFLYPIFREKTVLLAISRLGASHIRLWKRQAQLGVSYRIVTSMASSENATEAAFESITDQTYGRGVGPIFRDRFLQWLGVTRASCPPVPSGHRLSCCFDFLQ